MFHNYGGCAIHTVDPEPPVNVTDFLYMYKPATSSVTREVPANRVYVAQYTGTDKHVVIPNPNYPLSSQYVQVGRLYIIGSLPIDTGIVADGDVMELEVSRSFTGGNPPHYCPILQWSDSNGVWTGLGADKDIINNVAYSYHVQVGANDNGVQDTLSTNKNIEFRYDTIQRMNLVYSTVTGEATLTIDNISNPGTPYVVTKTFNSIAKSTGPTLQLLGNNQGEYFDSGMCIVECKIKKDNVLVLHYVPVYNMGTQKYGFLDLVSNNYIALGNSYPYYMN